MAGSLGGFGQIAERFFDRPNMWSPNWTAKLRPMTLPSESHGSTYQGNQTGLGAIHLDTLPYFILASTLGLFDPDFSLASGIRDAAYLHRATTAFSGDKMEGLSK
jgi:hypothetical protein